MIFHDSRGIEAGGIKDLDILQKFVDEHSVAVRSIRQQLHAIWCMLLSAFLEVPLIKQLQAMYFTQ